MSASNPEASAKTSECNAWITYAVVAAIIVSIGLCIGFYFLARCIYRICKRKHWESHTSFLGNMSTSKKIESQCFDSGIYHTRN